MPKFKVGLQGFPFMAYFQKGAEEGRGGEVKAGRTATVEQLPRKTTERHRTLEEHLEVDGVPQVIKRRVRQTPFADGRPLLCEFLLVDAVTAADAKEQFNKLVHVTHTTAKHTVVAVHDGPTPKLSADASVLEALGGSADKVSGSADEAARALLGRKAPRVES